MSEQIKELKAQAEEAKASYMYDTITRKEAIERVTPYVKALNKKGRELAKKYGMRPKPVTVIGFLR